MKWPFVGYRRRTNFGVVGVVVMLVVSARTGAAERWTVHEWGTFTSLQDEDGQAIGGINTDDEPVPKFVHRLADYLLLPPTEVPPAFFQGAPSCHPDVTMRLETPVIYFHPPPGDTHAARMDLQVQFRGGWLSEFFPNAEVNAPGLTNAHFQFGRLLATTVSSLAWTNLTIGGGGRGPETTAHVWTAPRTVEAAAVQTPGGESEKFLFYRGVAHIDAPLAISRDPQADRLVFRSRLEPGFAPAAPLQIQSIWLADILPDRAVAFRILPPLSLEKDSDKVLAETAASFQRSEFSRGNLQKLKASLHDALVAAGLFGDEAQALLDTWELSYFQNPGLRAFFLVPQAWTDFYLPLECSTTMDLKRVMVGRVELVTPEQRTALEKLSRFSTAAIKADAGQLSTNFYSRFTAPFSRVTSSELEAVNAGQTRLASFAAVPESYRIYLDLGRFRNALLLDQARRHPSPGLDAFISAYRLEPYRLPETIAAAQ